MNPKLAAASTVLSALATAAAVHARPTPTVIYVDASAPAGGDGHSWESAFRELQDALDAVNSSYEPAIEVWIAGGSYSPGRGSLNRGACFTLQPHLPTSAAPLVLPPSLLATLGAAGRFAGLRADDHPATPVVASGQTLVSVGLVGGFAGRGAVSPGTRDPHLFPTILTGDLLRNDGDDPSSRADNSFTVIAATLPDQTELFVTGLTVRAGHAEVGSYLAASGGRLTGGRHSNVTLNTVTIEDNQGGGGAAGLLIQAPRLAVVDCVFRRNKCQLPSNWSPPGGALSVDAGITSNLYSLLLRDSLFENNEGGYGAGASLRMNAGRIIVDSCTFLGNFASADGGAMFLSAPDIELHDSTIRGNHAGAIGGGLAASGRLVADKCAFSECGARIGGALALTPGFQADAPQSFVGRSVFEFNVAASLGGAVDAQASVGLWRTQFVGNRVSGLGLLQGELARGGAVNTEATFLAQPAIESCQFLGNTVHSASGVHAVGGAVASKTPLLIRSTGFSGNGAAAGAAAAGGALYAEQGASLENCTIANCWANSATANAYAGGIATAANISSLDNCVLWANRDASGVTLDAQFLSFLPFFSFELRSNIITGLPAVEDALRNSGLDPMFADQFGPDGVPGTADDDLTPVRASPCVDATYLTQSHWYGDADALGRPRCLDVPQVPNRDRCADRGAYEYQGNLECIRYDIYLDNQVNNVDLVLLISWFGRSGSSSAFADFDGDGQVGTQDLVLLLSRFGCSRWP